MSLWLCPTHGLYGGDVFCPACGGTGEYVTLAPAQVGRNAKRQDPSSGLGPQGEHAVGAEGDDAPTPPNQDPPHDQQD